METRCNTAKLAQNNTVILMCCIVAISLCCGHFVVLCTTGPLYRRVLSLIRFIKERYSFTLLSEIRQAPGGMLWGELKSHENKQLLRSDHLQAVVLM